MPDIGGVAGVVGAAFGSHSFVGPDRQYLPSPVNPLKLGRKYRNINCLAQPRGLNYYLD
jgi:hypothetical protein